MATYVGESIPVIPILGVNKPHPGRVIGNTGPVVAIEWAQRVFSSGLNTWCYYNGPLNPSPDPSETTPNWTVSITAYQILAKVGTTGNTHAPDVIPFYLQDGIHYQKITAMEAADPRIGWMYPRRDMVRGGNDQRIVYPDGALYIEPAFNSPIIHSSAFDNPAWVKTSVTVTPNTHMAPDHNLVADTLSFDASASALVESNGWAGTGNGQSWLMTVFARVASGTGTIRLGILERDGATYTIGSDQTVTTEWKRFSQLVNTGTGSSTPKFVIQNGSDGAARSVIVAGACGHASLGLSPYPIMPNYGTTSTPSAATMSLSISPALATSLGMYTARLRWKVWPNFDSGALDTPTSQVEHWVWSTESSHGIRFRRTTSGTCEVVFFASPSPTHTAAVLVFDRHQELTLDIDLSTFNFIISGATSGNGTFPSDVAVTPVTGEFRIGRLSTSTALWSGVISPPEFVT